MNKDQLEKLARLFNRSNNQVGFLLGLLDDNVELLFRLENTIRNNFLSYCPGDVEEVEKVLTLNELGRNNDGVNYGEVQETKLLEDLVGLNEEDAFKLCSDNMFEVRIMRKDSTNFVGTTDLNHKRVNLEFDNDLVTECNLG